MNTRNLAYILATVLASLSGSPAIAWTHLVESNFDSDFDGWGISSFHIGECCNDAVWVPNLEGGNIYTTTTPYLLTAFEAPSKFHGDFSAALGGSLSFKQSLDTLLSPAVRTKPLVYVSDGTAQLQFWGEIPPSALVWTETSIPLDAAMGWEAVPANPGPGADRRARWRRLSGRPQFEGRRGVGVVPTIER